MAFVAIANILLFSDSNIQMLQLTEGNVSSAVMIIL